MVHDDEKHPQIYEGDPRPLIPPCVMASLAMGLKSGGLQVFADRAPKIKAEPKHPWSLRAVQHFTHVLSSCSDRSRCRYICTWQTMFSLLLLLFLWQKKTRRPSIWAPCRDKSGTGSGISLVYMWKHHNSFSRFTGAQDIGQTCVKS